MDETTAELKKMAIELENEKAKTDRLLHEMLPEKVADQLKQGKTVEAGEQLGNTQTSQTLKSYYFDDFSVFVLALTHL